ncbi:beta-1,6-N-acetylglucosaminyltransferase [Paracoccus fistulariae]|uniref:Peptide O-xylosyltransferase n=1 Tax=Paracoccus fistulariae TaxID=658446 RepID=A0ABY7SKD1_9RHOB|nr:beta-1,6-N-acetylglucosaminyltransferase [Paracoccus fistulariae]MDB6181122.1 glycosyl transferase [Paracoccus fistulariae]WCR06411.1 glycosyl transferase [Paracoccus fistulariae]
MSGQVRLGVILLCHSELDMAARMARIWAEGGARVAIHVDAKVSGKLMNQFKAGLGDLDEVIFAPRTRCSWGRFSLVKATQDAATVLLQKFPDLTHVYLCSGTCLPLRPISDLRAYLALDPDCDHIESVTASDVGWTVGGLNEERFTLYFPFDWRKRRKLFDRFTALQRRYNVNRRIPKGVWPHLGSQWWCLTARTLRAILQDPRRKEFDRYFRLSWIPDESYFQTLVRRHSTRIESRSLTLSRFDHRGRPYQLYDDHIAVLTSTYSFVARKVWPGATKLLAHFPRPASDRVDLSAPQSNRFDAMINRVVTRRTLGRPGLYMQSRFPRKDAENGKTSDPYVVFQGLGDIYPRFESWLADHVHGDIHGHLLGPELVEFQGRPKVGPGGWPANALVRDLDTKGFLASLIRITDRTQIFQYGPRDNQSLNWFMATDPNARMLVVTGAWALPLLHSGMPFDDIRRIFAMLQRTELAQLSVLNSVWVKAQVEMYDLGEFLVSPRSILNDFLRHIDPQARPAINLPEMRSLSGLAELLRELRDSGLLPRLTGDNLPPAEEFQITRTAAE